MSAHTLVHDPQTCRCDDLAEIREQLAGDLEVAQREIGLGGVDFYAYAYAVLEAAVETVIDRLG